jgi:hypothetical protein
MPRTLYSAIQATRPAMPFVPRAIVEAILLTEGPIGSAGVVAGTLGLGSRFRLARLLKREGLPSLHRLAGWVTVEAWVSAAEREGTSLFRLAYRSHRHPSACYRLVKEVTGLSWMEVRKRGSGWVRRQLIERIKAKT